MNAISNHLPTEGRNRIRTRRLFRAIKMECAYQQYLANYGWIDGEDMTREGWLELLATTANN